MTFPEFDCGRQAAPGRGFEGPRASIVAVPRSKPGYAPRMTIELGRLKPVLPRDVWAHEATNFTPWLLILDNVDVLSDLLGMDLVLERAEHPVGGFSLDLLGHDEATGQVVIVENQLEISDHTHLGQILTYAAGTNPTTIVWIATGFRSEHRAAIDWLNERTDENTRFFGVEIQVVRIGDSIPAPAFKLVAQPNDWGKQVKASTTSGEGSEKGQQYWEFWEQFLTRIHTDHPTWTRARTATRGSWLDLSLTPGVVLDSSFTRQGLSAWIYFGSSDQSTNLARFQEVSLAREKFELVLGEPAVWDEMVGRKAARIGLKSPYASVTEADKWPAMIAWLVDAQVRLRAALEAVGSISS